jgi:hypothetical protein
MTKWDFSLAGNPLMADNSFEIDETQYFIELLREFDCLVNIGANIGYYCCHALNLGKEIIAFEPDPWNYKLLLRNISVNFPDSHCLLFNNAVSHNQIHKLYGSGTGASLIKGWSGIGDSNYTLCSGLNPYPILSCQLIGKRVIFLVDVEGNELNVINALSPLLSELPDSEWIVEVSNKHHQPSSRDYKYLGESVYRIFFNHGYRAKLAIVDGEEISPSSLRSIDYAEDAKIQNIHFFR